MGAPSIRKSKARSDDEDSYSSPIQPAPLRGRRSEDNYVSSKKRRRRSRYASGYSMPREKPSKVDLLLCVFHGGHSHNWRTASLNFDRRRMDDRELWEDIRQIYRDDLQGLWRRILGFKRVKHIVPIEVYGSTTSNFFAKKPQHDRELSAALQEIP